MPFRDGRHWPARPRRLSPEFDCGPYGKNSTMKRRPFQRIAPGLLLVSLFSAGCGPAQRYFNVVSYPDQATIFVDDIERGRTNAERLLVSFSSRQVQTIRVEKNGYQTAGILVYPDSPGKIDFFLHRAPEPERVLQKLDDLSAKLDRLASQVSELSAK